MRRGKLRALGRHVEHDVRSRTYAVPVQQTLTSARVWWRRGPILDQGELGACTGFAAAGLLNCAPFNLRLDASDAIGLYSHATQLDAIPGSYPPEDTGSSGLAVAKAAALAGLITSYRHAFSLLGCLHALQVGPVICGIPWYATFDEPIGEDAELILGGPGNDEVRGGHEVVLRGFDAESKMVHGFSSWGDGWGDHGGFVIAFETLRRLLGEHGDVTQFVL